MPAACRFRFSARPNEPALAYLFAMFLNAPVRTSAALFICCTASSPSLAQSEIPSVDVVGRRSSGSYAADAAEGAKSAFPLRELPQAVRVLTRQTLDDLAALRLDDALDYAGGVSRQNSFGGLWDNIAIRGLPGDINNGIPLLVNGVSASRGFNAPRDTANIERVEFLKGPAAALYGASEPGGTVNIVTKQPLFRRATAFEAYAGSAGLGRMAIDTTGPVSSTLAYRVNAAVEKRDGWRDHVDSSRVFAAPALMWRMGQDSTLNYEGEYLRHRTPLDRGIPARFGRMGDVPRERFLGEPADGKVTNRNTSHQLRFSQRLGDDWRARVALSHKSGALTGFSTEPVAALEADERTLRRQRRYRDYGAHDTSLQAELVGSFDGPFGRHELLAGVQLDRFDLDQRMLRANPTAASPYAIDVLAPAYGQVQPTPMPSVHTDEDQENRAVYVQDSLRLGEQWRLLAGLRHDRFDQVLLNRRTGVRTHQAPTSTSPRLGLSYLASPEWTLFANAGTSFRPNAGTDAQGRSFEPEHAKALETGLKWQALDGKFGATLALFDIRKRDVLTSDPANAGFSITAGELRSRGLDFDASGELARGWRVNGSLSLMDAQVRRDHLLAQGARLLNIPRVNASLLLTRELYVAGHRAVLGGGITHTGRRLGEALTQAQVGAGRAPFWLPAYTLVRATAQWQVNARWRVTLDIDNLFDRDYYPNSFQRTWVTPGQGRSVMAGIQGRY
jgi:iron complex outermembrane receptor protein